MSTRKFPVTNCCAETLMATRASGQPSRRHLATASAAVSRIQSFRSSIRPDCSAISMNSPAATIWLSLRRQRSNASTAVVRCLPEADLRLVVQHEVAAFDGLAQGLFDAEPVRRLHQHRRVVHAQTVATEFLGAEQCHVGRAQQRRRVAAMLRKHRDAAAHADRHLASIDEQRPLEPADQLFGASLDFARVARVREHQRELVAAEPRDEARVARDLAQSLADFGQDAVAEFVAERVVDGLEVVEVEEQHGDVRAGRARGRGGIEHLVQALEQLAPVRQVRERIVLGEVPQLQRAFARRDARAVPGTS